jgi:hypothetical protein
MLKRWYEAKPFTFGAVFIFLVVAINTLDQIFMYPIMKPVCNGQITDQEARSCTDWIRKKEKGHVRTTQRGHGGLSRDTSPDGFLREQERAITDFGGTQNKSEGYTKDY